MGHDGDRRVLHGRRASRASKRVAALLAIVLAVSVLQTVKPATVQAHNWEWVHWNRGGSKVDIYVWDQTGGCGTAGTPTNDSLYDLYYNPHPLWFYCVNSHTDVTVFEANEAGVNFCGLAEVIESSWWGHWHVAHAHARVNTRSSCQDRRLNIPGLTLKQYKQGIHCQEIWHTIGFDHSDTSDCMGGVTGSYFYNSRGKYFIGSTGPYNFDWDHQTVDAYNRYRYH